MHCSRLVVEGVAALVLVAVALVSGFPSGAPLSACGHLMPIHEDAVAQETASPFLILLSETNYTTHHPIQGLPPLLPAETPDLAAVDVSHHQAVSKGREDLRWTIQFMTAIRQAEVTVTSGEPYLAFMLQGRTRDNRPVGHFSVAPPVSKFLSCYGDDDTLSHAAAFGRTAMEFTWHPPTEDVGDVFITGSIARTKYIFWAVESESIKGQKRYIPNRRPGAGSGAGGSATRPSTSASAAATALSLVILVMLRAVFNPNH